MKNCEEQSITDFSDTHKFLNDHDLRVLVEQNVEIRHQETLTVAILSVTAAVLFALLRNVAYPSANIQRTAKTINTLLSIWRDDLGPKFLLWMPIIGGVVFGAGLVLKNISDNSEKRLDLIYKNLAKRNSLKPDELIRIHGFIAWRVKLKDGEEAHLTRNRSYLSSMLTWIGAGLFLVPNPGIILWVLFLGLVRRLPFL